MELFNYSNSKIEPRKGDLLISEPFLIDPNFVRTVILLCEHNEDGTLGFVLNKPAQIVLNELIEEAGSRDDKIFIGGPVQQNTLQYMHRLGGLIEGGIEIAKDLFWGGNFDQIMALLDGELIKKEDIKFFVGYSGWAPGQLKDELELNSWIIYRNVSVKQIFDLSVDSLWKEVLNNMGGKYKIISNFPVDPRLN